VLTEIFAGVTACGSVLTAGAVAIGVRQLHLTQKEVELQEEQARTSFEDDLSREYRAIVGELPVEAFHEDAALPPTDATRRSFYRYFDLSNEQLFHVKNRRISGATADQWLDGIKGNLSLPGFASAWHDLRPHLREDFFRDLGPVADAACSQREHSLQRIDGPDNSPAG
jgi:hypothetical protein